MLLLRSMPEQYRNTIEILTAKKKVNWEHAVLKLQSKEIDIKSNSTAETGDGAYASRAWKPADRGQCNYCWSRDGHYRANCPKRKQDQERMGQQEPHKRSHQRSRNGKELGN
jgi:hypothetical protein